jgi:hypothetical protein
VSEVQILQSPGATNPKPGEEKADAKKRDARWWALPEGDRATVVHDITYRIFRQNLWRHEAYRRYMRTYNNMLGMMWSPMLMAGIDRTGANQKLSLNVIKSCSDTFTSKMTLERPKCTFLTSGGDWSLQNKAKDLEKFVDGQFYEMRLYEEMPSIVLDTCVYGTGALKVLIDGDLRDEEKAKDAKVIIERTPIWSLGVDTRDAIMGKPRTMVQTRVIDRSVLCAMFPTKEKEIQKADPPTMGEERNFPMWMIADDSTADQVQINMIWHLPSSKSSNDGWYWIGTSNCQLDMQPWNYDYFPFAFYRRMPPLAGFYGVGLAEELRGIQQDINMMIQKAQAAIHLMAVPKWWLQGNGAVPPGIMSNGIEIIRGMVKPEVMVPPGVLPPGPPDVHRFS